MEFSWDASSITENGPRGNIEELRAVTIRLRSEMTGIPLLVETSGERSRPVTEACVPLLFRVPFNN